jgi:hypothetical protein
MAAKCVLLIPRHASVRIDVAAAALVNLSLDLARMPIRGEPPHIHVQAIFFEVLLHEYVLQKRPSME